MKKTIISIVLTAAILLSVFAAVPFSANAAGTTYTVSTVTELNAACEAINTNGGEATISLEANIIGAIDIQKDDAVVTVVGNGHTLTSPSVDCVISAEKGAVINIGDGESELTLTCTDVQDPNVSRSVPGVVYVKEDGVCNMYSKVTIKDHETETYLGGGVTVEDGTFHMYGGTIDNCGVNGGSVCYGGGVAVFGGGIFIMDDGVISNCYATSDYYDAQYTDCYTGAGGGVFVSGGSTFIMNGGTITNNDATSFGGGVAMMLGDIEVQKDPTTGETIINPKTDKGYVDLGNPGSKVAINGGKIINNTAKNGAGVFASGIYYSFYQTICHDPIGVGTPSDPGLYINGANKDVEISSNTATENGGGVFVVGLRNTRKAQIYNADIKNNTANKGAGVINYGYWTQLDIDGCNITENSATSNGGGVMAVSNSDGGYTSIKDTTIKDNTSGDRGAGVCYDGDSEIRIAGKDVIQDNTYGGKQNNLNILSVDKPVKVVGDLTGSQIGLSDPELWDDGKEDTDADAVSAKRLTDGYKANNASLIPADAFTSDHESWYVDFGEIKNKEVASDEDYYTYEGKKYNVKSRTDSGESCTGQLYFVKPNTFDTGIAENPTVFKKEVLSRFSDTNKYSPEYSDGEWYDCKNKQTDDFVTIWFPNEYNARIYLNDPGTYYNSNILIATSTGHQIKYADSGEFVYQYYFTATSDILEYYDNYSTSEIHRNEPLDDDEEVYEYDELGQKKKKTVISKTPIRTPHQVTTVLDYDYTSEVRLVRRTAPIKFHDNKNTVNKGEDNLFRVYNADDNEDYGEIENGEHSFNSKYQISPFYDIPSFAEDDYVFAGWYYHTDGNKDGDIPFKFDSTIPANLTDVYAHWIPVGKVNKAEEDDKVLPEAMGGKYRGFELFGVQIRPEDKTDINYGEVKKPGGLRFITSISEELLTKIDALSDKTTNGNKVEYGYVTAAQSMVESVISKFNTDHPGTIDTSKYKLQYKGTNVNGVDTTVRGYSADNFRYITNVDCTSKQRGYGGGSAVMFDHQNYNNYRLATYVVTYDDNPDDKSKNVAARAYLRYYDANGLLRTFYNDYAGTSFYGGCSISYNGAEELVNSNTNTTN